MRLVQDAWNTCMMAFMLQSGPSVCTSNLRTSLVRTFCCEYCIQHWTSRCIWTPFPAKEMLFESNFQKDNKLSGTNLNEIFQTLPFLIYTLGLSLEAFLICKKKKKIEIVGMHTENKVIGVAFCIHVFSCLSMTQHGWHKWPSHIHVYAFFIIDEDYDTYCR